jgi:hemerythrin-like domain-containing protein
MPVLIGKTIESDYTNPLGLLSDCHRRIERFLNLLFTVVSQATEAKLRTEERQALATALRYFREAAPKHTRDEEESLFPRLRASQNPQAQAAFSMLDTLHEDHETADISHQQVEVLCLQWLSDDYLQEESRNRLSQLLTGLKSIYERHIAVEDTQIFPLARKILNASQLQSIASEMASRRGIELSAYANPQNFS